MEHWKLLINQAAAAAKAAQDIAAKGSLPDGGMTTSERARYEEKYAEALRLRDESNAAKADHDSQTLLTKMANHAADAPDNGDGPDTNPGGPGSRYKASAWAKQVQHQLTKASAQAGVKALLTGEIRTPSVVEVVDLPTAPKRLLDLIARDPLTEHTFNYLRQVARTNEAAVVPDGGQKPVSTFTWQEFEDKARVIAHLSEPFPLRYLSDHQSVLQVLDSEMANGVYDTLEQQVLAGTGVNTTDDDLSELPGLLTTTGTIAVPFVTDRLTTIRHARTLLENLGEVPNAWVFNPLDIEAIELQREGVGTGAFLMDSGAYDAVFGPGVLRVPSVRVPVGTAILGDWSQLRLQVREDVATLAANQAGDLWATNRVQLRSEGRFGIKNSRPQAFAIVDLAA